MPHRIGQAACRRRDRRSAKSSVVARAPSAAAARAGVRVQENGPVGPAWLAPSTVTVLCAASCGSGRAARGPACRRTFPGSTRNGWPNALTWRLSRSAWPWPALAGQPSGPTSKISWWPRLPAAAEDGVAAGGEDARAESRRAAAAPGVEGGEPRRAEQPQQLRRRFACESRRPSAPAPRRPRRSPARPKSAAATANRPRASSGAPRHQRQQAPAVGVADRGQRAVRPAHEQQEVEEALHAPRRPLRAPPGRCARRAPGSGGRSRSCSTGRQWTARSTRRPRGPAARSRPRACCTPGLPPAPGRLELGEQQAGVEQAERLAREVRVGREVVGQVGARRARAWLASESRSAPEQLGTERRRAAEQHERPAPGDRGAAPARGCSSS